MGLWPSNWSDSQSKKCYVENTVIIREPQYKSPNPNPHKFSVVKILQLKNYLIVELKYFGCTTYDGHKLMIFKTTKTNFLKRVVVDPHFLGDKNDPIARFAPTQNGWYMAKQLCNILNRVDTG